MTEEEKKNYYHKHVAKDQPYDSVDEIISNCPDISPYVVTQLKIRDQHIQKYEDRIGNKITDASVYLYEFDTTERKYVGETVETV